MIDILSNFVQSLLSSQSQFRQVKQTANLFDQFARIIFDIVSSKNCSHCTTLLPFSKTSTFSTSPFGKKYVQLSIGLSSR